MCFSLLHTLFSTCEGSNFSCLSNVLVNDCSYSIVFYSRLCPSTAGSSPLPESSNFLCPLLSLSIPLPVAPQCHLSNDILIFQLILCPSSATLCSLVMVHLLFFIRIICPSHFHCTLFMYWAMSLWFFA